MVLAPIIAIYRRLFAPVVITPRVAPKPKRVDHYANGLKSSLDDVMREVCAYYRVDRGDILSSRREHRIALPRHVVFYIARNSLKLSYPNIAMAIGRRDHTTALYGARKIERLLEKGDADLAVAIATINLRLNAKGES